MAQSNAEKQSSSQSSPVVFANSKHKPDVRLFVFDKEFHVYSGGLRMNSAFFDTMLEPSGGVQPISSSPHYWSDWFTILDEDLGWVLTSDHKMANQDLSGFKGVKVTEEKAFQNLMSAIFIINYVITDDAELAAMVRQGDYYGALPILSYSISGSLFSSPGLVSSIPRDPCSILASAYKLRHKTLFQEAFIYTLGPWSDPQYKKLTDQVLLSLAETAYAKMESIVLHSQSDIFRFFAKIKDQYAMSARAKTDIRADRTLEESINSLPSSCLGERNIFLMPKCYQKIYNEDDRNVLYKAMGHLLVSNLVLDKISSAGEGDFEDYFLFYKISDADFPWDTSQIDW